MFYGAPALIPRNEFRQPIERVILSESLLLIIPIPHSFVSVRINVAMSKSTRIMNFAYLSLLQYSAVFEFALILKVLIT
jgi:hypothetical protein